MTTRSAATMTPPKATSALHAHLLEPMDGDAMPDPVYVRELLAAGADINTPDKEGLPPLLRCLSWRYAQFDPDVFKEAAQETLDLLLQGGADLAATRPDGTTAAVLADAWKDRQLATQKLACEAYRRSHPALAAAVARICTTWPKPGDAVTPNIKDRFIAALQYRHDR